MFSMCCGIIASMNRKENNKVKLAGGFIILKFFPTVIFRDNPCNALRTVTMAIADILASDQIPAGIFQWRTVAGVDYRDENIILLYIFDN